MLSQLKQRAEEEARAFWLAYDRLRNTVGVQLAQKQLAGRPLTTLHVPDEEGMSPFWRSVLEMKPTEQRLYVCIAAALAEAREGWQKAKENIRNIVQLSAKIEEIHARQLILSCNISKEQKREAISLLLPFV